MLRVRRDVMRPGWHPDPTGRHRYREWNGRYWTEHVSDYGVASIDPFEARISRRIRRPKRRTLLSRHRPTASALAPAARGERHEEWRHFWGDS